MVNEIGGYKIGENCGLHSIGYRHREPVSSWLRINTIFFREKDWKISLSSTSFSWCFEKKHQINSKPTEDQIRLYCVVYLRVFVNFVTP